MICNSLKNQWKNFTCESEQQSPTAESKLCQEMLQVTSEESISKDCQEICVKTPNNQMPDGRICINLYLAIQSSTPKLLGENGHGLPPKIMLGENGHGLPPPNMLLGENGHGLPPPKKLLGENDGHGLPSKITNNEEKPEEYNIDDVDDDENEEGTKMQFFYYILGPVKPKKSCSNFAR